MDTTLYKGSGRVRGKIAVVTGGSQAIGKTVVEVLAKEGAAVHFCGRREPPGRAVEAALRKAGCKVYFASVDVSDEAALRAWIDGVGERDSIYSVKLRIQDKHGHPRDGS